MSKDDRKPAARTEAALRKERQAAALRENLRRRKARERVREAPPAKSDGSGTRQAFGTKVTKIAVSARFGLDSDSISLY